MQGKYGRFDSKDVKCFPMTCKTLLAGLFQVGLLEVAWYGAGLDKFDYHVQSMLGVQGAITKELAYGDESKAAHFHKILNAGGAAAVQRAVGASSEPGSIVSDKGMTTLDQGKRGVAFADTCCADDKNAARRSGRRVVWVNDEECAVGIVLIHVAQ